MNTADWRAELGTKTTEILGRYGVAGRVEVESRLVWLIGNGPTVEVRLTEADASNAAQSSTELKSLAERLARDLSRARRAASRESGSTSDWLAWARLVPVLAIVAFGIWVAVRYLAPQKPAVSGSWARRGARLGHELPKPASSGPAGALEAKQALDDQSCLRTVSRIQQGGTVTPLDTDGWVVELSLLSERADLVPTAAALNDYFRLRSDSIERTHHAANTPVLNQIDAQLAGVLVTKEPLAQVSPDAASGILITWGGQYVTAYFQETDRVEYLKVADLLFNSLHASYGALYARCIQGSARYLGSWFRGPSVGAALWMLVAEMQVVVGSSAVPGASNGQQNWSTSLKQLADATRTITRRKAAYVLSTSGGSIWERAGQFATVEFPFSPANRANVAGSTLAHKVWPGSDSRAIPIASAMH